MIDAADLRTRSDFSIDEMAEILGATRPDEIEEIRRAAENVLLENCGSEVYYRGLIEYSNICQCDCCYCGIRRSNKGVHRYELSVEQIVDAAKWCAQERYGSVVIQSGERRDKAFIKTIVEAVRLIKRETRSDALPQGLGITLSLGEQSLDSYRHFREAGAHRYLLRIETSDPSLFAQIHPNEQSFQSRLESLDALREAGFQVGTGVMIGLPGQTTRHLAGDIAFFKEKDIDMIGMGPFIPHEATPIGQTGYEIDRSTQVQRSLLMIAMTRLAMPDINIAATTALQALDPIGREKGLKYGANVIMPLLTPSEVRSDYLLYPGKPCLDESASQCRACLEARISSIGRTIGYDKWGDSRHALERAAPK
ncbi:MAG: [FeFe] hydrogenase H-cluster radical SAM maturase HydE [Candidatus Coatesbacteria bacterium]|nr:[FeFe] hydrogenase H-cluster radical SAM maturase HydE [Candidatus Coatesbacteria bacterium]